LNFLFLSGRIPKVKNFNQGERMEHSFVKLAHRYWKELLQEGDWAIDATCGNGHDTLVLTNLLKTHRSWGVLSLDIQEAALKNTQERLREHLSSEELSHIHFFQHSHETFPSLAKLHPIRLIVYNLGYLPGVHNKKTTLTSTTLISVENALQLLIPGGMLSILCYPGHEEGLKEQTALIEQLAKLPPLLWQVRHHALLNKPTAPSLILVQKT
jgi:hypothetical protein